MSAVVAQHLDRVRAGFGRLDSLSWRATTVLIVACALVALAIRIWVNREIQAPYILTDELQYAAAAEKLAHEGDLPPASHGFLYPVLIAPSWLADSATSAYSWAKSLNVVLMTLAVVPLFLWARRVVSPALALVAAVLVLVLPSFIYSGTIMTENAFFPAFVLATYAIARALERPTVRGQVFALAAIALAIAVRQQGVVLILVLASAIPLKVFFDLRADGDRATWKLLAPMVGRYRVLVGALGLSLIGYLIATVARGASVGSGLGAYEAAIGAEYDVRDAVRWVVFHFGELALTSGVVPMMALLVLLAVAASRHGGLSASRRSFVAVAVPSVVWLVVQVGIVASQFAGRVQERNMFHVVPLLLLALVVWLDCGLPRPRRAVVVATGLVAAAVVAVPYVELLNPALVNDTFGLVPLLNTAGDLARGTEDIVLLVGLAVIAIAIGFGAAPRRLGSALFPAMVGLFLVVSSVMVFDDVQRAGASYRNAPSLGVDADWVDRAVGGSADVAIVGGIVDPFSTEQLIRWQTDFFNRSVRSTRVIGADVVVDPATGRFGPKTDEIPELNARYVIVEPGVGVIGRLVADRPPLALYEVEQPLRIATAVEGLFPDGWSGDSAAFTMYGGASGAPTSMAVTVSRARWTGSEVFSVVEISIGPLGVGVDGQPTIRIVTDSEAVGVGSGSQSTVSLAAPPPPFRVEIEVENTFSPADVGAADTRELGVQVSFAPVE